MWVCRIPVNLPFSNEFLVTFTAGFERICWGIFRGQSDIGALCKRNLTAKSFKLCFHPTSILTVMTSIRRKIYLSDIIIIVLNVTCFLSSCPFLFISCFWFCWRRTVMFYIIYSQYFLKTEKNRSKTLKPKNKNICSLQLYEKITMT